MSHRLRPATVVLTCAVVLASLFNSGCATQAARKENDPLEPLNRKIFWFNDTADTYVLVPVAKGWDFIMPERGQHVVARVFSNLNVPANAVNNLLQGKPIRAISDMGRFVLNSTIGIIGMFDPATGWGLPKHEEDFGQTLGFWGVPAGPFIVIPLLGPSNLRDVFGRIADVGLSAIGLFVDAYILIPLNALDIINTRALYLDDVEAAKAGALDYYLFVRDAYRQRREALIRDARESAGEVNEDLYYLDVDEPAGTEDLYYPDGNEPAGTEVKPEKPAGGTPDVAPELQPEP